MKEDLQGGRISLKGGFTLIELIMVLILAGIMAAIAVPKFSKVSAIDVAAVARQVQSDIRYAQELAMSKYRLVRITFSFTTTNTYEIRYLSDNSLVESKILPARSKAQFDSTGSTTGAVNFDSLGEPYGEVFAEGSDAIIRISAGGFYKDIKVEARTGKVTIQ